MPVEPDPFIHFADVGDLLTANLCAALLQDAGIEARVHGEALGPYPVTIGRLAVTEVWVRQGDVAEARLVMMEAEIEHTLGDEVRGGAIADPGSLPMRIGAVAVLGTLVWAVAHELMRVF